MAELKTKPGNLSADEFLQKIEPEQKRKDSYRLLEMMQRLSGCSPKMWGSSMVGFGQYHYKYASGHEGDSFLTGFSPRKQSFSIYLVAYEYDKDLSGFLQKLGKHKTGKGCLYINKLSDVDETVLEGMIAESLRLMKERYPDAG
jgi:hypothetical protein